MSVIARKNFSICRWSQFKNWSRNIPPLPPLEISACIKSPKCLYHHRVSNEMTTPKSFHVVTTPTESLGGFIIISDRSQIATFAKYFSTLMFPLLQCYVLTVLCTHPKFSNNRFLPKLAKQTLEQTLESVGIEPSRNEKDIEALTSCSVSGGVLRIGNTSCDVYQSSQLMKVPDTLFYDNALVCPRHSALFGSVFNG